jgi:opacity protein-like surface antigen
MKKSTKYLLIILVSLLAFQSYAQTFGVRGGLNLANILEEDDDEKYSEDYKMHLGFHIGATMDYPISDLLSLSTGLFISTKGFKCKEQFIGGNETVNGNFVYLDIPLTVKGMHDLGEGIKLLGAAGPYIGIGIGGKFHIEGEDFSGRYDEDQDIEWGSDEYEDNLKRPDFGFTLGAGVEVKAIQFWISYDLGLANISSYTDNGSKIKNRVLKFSVGYMFDNLLAGSD